MHVFMCVYKQKLVGEDASKCNVIMECVGQV